MKDCVVPSLELFLLSCCTEWYFAFSVFHAKKESFIFFTGYWVSNVLMKRIILPGLQLKPDKRPGQKSVLYLNLLTLEQLWLHSLWGSQQCRNLWKVIELSLTARLEVVPNLTSTGKRMEFHSLLDTGIFFFFTSNYVGMKMALAYSVWTMNVNSLLIFCSNRYRVAYNKETGQCKLEISMTFSDDAGEYIVFARNQLGEASASAMLLNEGWSLSCYI